MSQFIIDMTREELIMALKTANKERDLHERSALLEGQRLSEALKQRDVLQKKIDSDPLGKTYREMWWVVAEAFFPGRAIVREKDLLDRIAQLQEQAKGALADRDSLLAEIAVHGRDTFFSKWMENTLPKEEAEDVL